MVAVGADGSVIAGLATDHGGSMKRWLSFCGLVAVALGCRAVPSTQATHARASGPLPATEVTGDAPAPRADRATAAAGGAPALDGRGELERRRPSGAGPSQPPRYDVTHAAFAERW
ncbi:MAG: hypothetical protein IPK74_22325 [Deltaproteobacteria bacterium]|nr:hypothetical protein [Deltaproteobacteria bacterium]